VISIVVFLAIARAWGHTVSHRVRTGGVAVNVFYGTDQPADYAAYELYGPGDAVPFGTGRTDRNGVVCFLPDRPGEWRVKVLGDSSHGFHGTTVRVPVDKALNAAGDRQPPVALHAKLMTGIGVIFGLFGLLSLRRRQRT
jgi:nickel transport protein